MNYTNIEALIVKYIKDGDTVSIGSNELGEKFVKKLALAVEAKHIPIAEIHFVPTSFNMAVLARQMGLRLTDLNEREIDVAIEFVDQIDPNHNFIKHNSSSFVRDKMICQSAGLLVAITNDKYIIHKSKNSSILIDMKKDV